VSHAEQLSLSRCLRESGDRLWCGTCHNPHSKTSNRAEEIKSICLNCHAQLFTVQKHQAADECVTCHMPRLRPSNVAHAAITDHLIALPNPVKNSAAPAPGTTGLSAWRNPPGELAARNLALARFKIAAQTKDASQILRAYESLSHLPNKDHDPEVLATLGSILLQRGYGDAAISLYRQAVTAEPQNARFAYVLGAAYAQQGNQSAAIGELRRSISIDPSSPDAYRRLADLYDKAGEPAQSRRVRNEYLKFMPQNLEFRGAGQ
jgi:predicted CXXCH cytochrome family protein